MNYKEILQAVRGIGFGPIALTARYALFRDWLNKPYYEKQRRPTASVSPGLVIDTNLLPNGAVFRFERATLEIVFLNPDLARLTWLPGKPPVSYAIARDQWPEVTDQWHADLKEMTLRTDSLQITVQGDGGIIFSEPDGKVLREEFPPERQGEAWAHRCLLQPEERIYGLGERAARLNRRGGTYQMWNSDPGGTYGPGTDPIYTCIPVYLAIHSHGSYLVFYENSYPATFTFETAAEAIFAGGMLRYYILPGPPQHALERYAELSGRAELPPRWALGYHQCRWGYKTEDDIRRVIAGFKEHNLPISAIHLDIDYMQGYRVFTVNKERFPDLKKLTGELEAEDIKVVTIIDPGVKCDPQYFAYREGIQADIFVKEPNKQNPMGGKPLQGLVWPGLSVYPDFTNPNAREWWSNYYPRLLDAGVAGFWHDMNEPSSFAAWGDFTLPLTARHNFDSRNVNQQSDPNNRQGGDHAEAHNLYGLLMNRAGYESLRKHRPNHRPWLLSRSGWAGIQRYAWSWTGDTETSWVMLHQTIATVLGMGLSGLPFCGPDIGGFSGAPSAELYTRWFQLASFLPFFRTHSSWSTPPREPWSFGEPTTSIIRNFLLLRYRLLPYFYSLAWEASQTGHPLIRPLFWIDPNEPAVWEVDNAFMVGDSILVAPILEEGACCREVSLPHGRWYNFWDDTPLDGPGYVMVNVTLERIPLFMRGGSVLPMEEAGQLTLHIYPQAIDIKEPSENLSNTIYTDEGDGYGPYRLDHFDLLPVTDGLEIGWYSEGDFPFPDINITIQLHGSSPIKAWADGNEVDIDMDQIRTGVFKRVKIIVK